MLPLTWPLTTRHFPFSRRHLGFPVDDILSLNITFRSWTIFRKNHKHTPLYISRFQRYAGGSDLGGGVILPPIGHRRVIVVYACCTCFVCLYDCILNKSIQRAEASAKVNLLRIQNPYPEFGSGYGQLPKFNRTSLSKDTSVIKFLLTYNQFFQRYGPYCGKVPCYILLLIYRAIRRNWVMLE